MGGQRHLCFAQCGAGGSADSSVLLAHQFLGLGRPRHEFTVQDHPIRPQLFPKTTSVYRRAYSLQELALQGKVVEEAATGSRVADADTFADYAKAFAGHLFQRSEPDVVLDVRSSQDDEPGASKLKEHPLKSG